MHDRAAAVLELLAEFHQRHPGVDVKIAEATAGKLLSMLLEGGLDVALLASPEPLDSRFEARPIYSERFGLAFPPGHAFERLERLRLIDVAGEPYQDRINYEYGSFVDRLCLDRGVGIEPAYQSEREDWIMAMVAAGMGVCFLPEFSANHPGVRLRPLAEPEIVRVISVVTVAGRDHAPAVKAFVGAVGAQDWAMG